MNNTVIDCFHYIINITFSEIPSTLLIILFIILIGSTISYRANPLGCFILYNRVFENFILGDEPFADAYELLKLVYHYYIIRIFDQI